MVSGVLVYSIPKETDVVPNGFICVTDDNVLLCGETIPKNKIYSLVRKAYVLDFLANSHADIEVHDDLETCPEDIKKLILDSGRFYI